MPLTDSSITPAGLFAAFAYALYILILIQLIKRWRQHSGDWSGMMLAGLILILFSAILYFHWRLSVEVYLALAGFILVGTILVYTLFSKESV